MRVSDNGTVDEPRPPTVVGIQNGVPVYNETMQVSAPPGSGDSQFSFPEYTPVDAGDIMWEATIFDDDPYQDTATAVTAVKP